MKIKEHGHWMARASGNDHVLGVFVESDDYTHDVRLYVNGDFASLEQRFAYAGEIARRLNSWLETSTCMRTALEMYVSAGHGNSTDFRKQLAAYEAAARALK